MAKKRKSLKESILSYFESRKKGESSDIIHPNTLKPQTPKKIPNKINPLPIEDNKKTPKPISPITKDSIDGLIKRLNDISISSTSNNYVTNNYSSKNISNNETTLPKNILNNKTDMFNAVRNSFTNQSINKSSGRLKNTRGIVNVNVPKIITIPLFNNSEKTVDNSNSFTNNDIKEKINNISKETAPKFKKMNKPNRHYRATSANKRVPKIIELTHLTSKTKNVFKSLSNKMHTVVPSKTSSKILSSLVNYEANNNTSQSLNRHIHNSIKKMSVSNIVGKEKLYNLMQVPALQEGGIVDTPTLAMIGEGRKGETSTEIRPVDKKKTQLEIQKSKDLTASSVGKDSMNKNAAMKIENENRPGRGQDGGSSNAPPIMVSAPTGAPPIPRTPPQISNSSPSGGASMQTQTSFPRWRRGMG